MIELNVIGNLGKDCQVNNVNGKKVINFTVAHTTKFKDQQSGENKERTIWVECAYWTDKDGIVPYLKKGQQVYIKGEPEARAWQSPDGKCNASLKIRVFQVQLLGSAKDSNGNQEQQSYQQQQKTPTQTTKQDEGFVNTSAAQAAQEKDLADDLPF